MKCCLCLGVCFVFGVAWPVHAALINVTATRASYDGTLDQVILRVQSFGGPELPTGSFGESLRLTELVGAWSFGSGAINLPGTTNWSTKVLNDWNDQDSDGGIAGVGATTPQSWFNFSAKTADAYSRNGLVSGTLYHSFSEGFTITASALCGYGIGATDWTPGGTTDDGDGYGFDNTLLAVLYVSKATTLTPGQSVFTGSATYAAPYAGFPPGPYPTTVQIVPEPSTLSLVCVGLLGLLALARRRRR